ncbi:MAG: hypothetical protein HRU32_00390 [Rhodobacteraceae bacterium]|nr:hypothetical protein [Paracoccaceae bacterium]
MSVERDDLRAAVAAGYITEAQAASVLALSQSRKGMLDTAALDEPFELFRGFNEIFIVVGLTILFAGWSGFVGLTSLANLGMPSRHFVIYSVIGLAVLPMLATYFTTRRRMVAPSIALSIMFAITGLQFGFSLGWQLGITLPGRMVFMGAVTTTLLALWYWRFRIPFTMALIGIGVFLTAGATLLQNGAGIPEPRELFLLSAEGPFAVMTFALGLLGLAVALWFDMSDPHRVTRRAASAFWLHIIAAPAIVNTVALTLFVRDTPGALFALLAFLAAMAVFAIIIDRRSFLIAGVGYVIALSAGVLQDQAYLAILILGILLVYLGAQWEWLRNRLMNALPAFPGKSRLPPWAHDASEGHVS